jgi:hypothetical protein
VTGKKQIWCREGGTIFEFEIQRLDDESSGRCLSVKAKADETNANQGEESPKEGRAPVGESKPADQPSQGQYQSYPVRQCRQQV